MVTQLFTSHRQFSDIKALSRPKGINKATTTKNTRFPSCYAEVGKDDSAHCEWIFGQKGDSTSEYVHTPTPPARSLVRILKAVKDAVRKRGASSAISLNSSRGLGRKDGIELPTNLIF